MASGIGEAIDAATSASKTMSIDRLRPCWWAVWAYVMALTGKMRSGIDQGKGAAHLEIGVTHECRSLPWPLLWTQLHFGAAPTVLAAFSIAGEGLRLRRDCMGGICNIWPQKRERKWYRFWWRFMASQGRVDGATQVGPV